MLQKLGELLMKRRSVITGRGNLNSALPVLLRELGEEHHPEEIRIPTMTRKPQWVLS
jgi:hypothetical protein